MRPLFAIAPLLLLLTVHGRHSTALGNSALARAAHVAHTESHQAQAAGSRHTVLSIEHTAPSSHATVNASAEATYLSGLPR